MYKQNRKKSSLLITILFLFTTIFNFSLPVNIQAKDEERVSEENVQLLAEENDTALYKGSIIYNQVFFPEDKETKADLLNNLPEEEKDKYTQVIDLWDDLNENMEINLELPPDLAEGKHAFVTLGYKLNDDGSMDDILLDRLEATLEAAEDTRYDDSYIVVAGGGTAANSDITEADAMAEWLLEEGVEEERILVENESMNTVENALNTMDILYDHDVDSLTLISSPTHIRRAMAIYQAASLEMAEELEIDEPIELKENFSFLDKEYDRSLTYPVWHESDGTGRDVSRVLDIYTDGYRRYQRGQNTILFEANGAEGTGVILKTNVNNKVKIPSNDLTGFESKDQVFDGWSTKSNGGTTYQPGEEVELEPGTVLFAQWKKAKKQTHKIEDAEDFELIRQYPNDKFVIENDVEFEGEFDPIGVFNGEIDGQGHRLINLELGTVDTFEQTFRSLIVKNNGVIKNLHLIEPYAVNPAQFGSQYYVSNLVVYNYGEVHNVAASDAMADGGHQTGGLVVDNYGVIKNNKFSGKIISNWEAGSIAAVNRNVGVIEHNYTEAEVESVVQNSGILTGYAFGGDEGYVKNNVIGGGSIEATSVYGRVTGRLRDKPVVENNYVHEDTLVNQKVYTGEENAQNGINVTSEELAEEETYTDLGWDFENTWFMNEEDYRPDLISLHEDVLTEEELKKEAEKVKRLIYNLPKASELTLEDKEEVEEVRRQYEELPEKAKEYVNTISQLEKREQRLLELENQRDAEHVDSLISDLPAVEELTLTDKEDVEKAREAYENLSDEAKKLVTKLNELELLEEKLFALQLENLRETAERLDAEGELTDAQASRILLTHIRTLEHYVNKGSYDKVDKHLQGFEELLAYQFENELLTEKAYTELNDVLTGLTE